MDLRLDLRHALRLLRRSPSVTAIIVLTLALCIGANTAIFSVVDATLLRPLPYPEPERLVNVVTHYRGHGGEGDNTSQTGKTWEAIRDHASFLQTAAFSDWVQGVNFAAGGSVGYVQQERVGAGFFGVLGVAPLIGCEFTPEEDRPGGPPAVVLSHHLWQHAFHGDSAVVGKPVTLRGEPYTVVGVMPEHFWSGTVADLWTPLKPTTTGEGGGSNYGIVGRLKPGVTWPQAEAQVEALSPAALREEFAAGVTARLHLVPLQEGETQDLRKPLFILWAAVGLVLLIGCANVTSLLLARSAARTREIATRMALGGGRRAIVRQLLVETVVLAVLGGLAGLAVGYAGIEGLKILAKENFPEIAGSIHMDARVLVATGVLALIASLLAGIFPAFEASGVDIRMALTEAGGRGIAGVRKRWSRRLLVAGEVALAVLLLIGAGLLVRTLASLYQLRPGFDPANLVTASFSLEDARYTTTERVNHLFDAGLQRIRQIPGVESVAAGLSLPYERALNNGFQYADGPRAGPQYRITNYCYVTPDYFRTLRVPLLGGREIRTSDTATSQKVAVVNQAFVEKYLSRQDPVGSHLRSADVVWEIVGIVGDVQQRPGWGNFGPLGSPPTVYVPVTQTSGEFFTLVHTWFSPSWIVRIAGGSQERVIREIQRVATIIDPLVPIAEFRTVRDLRAQSLAFQRFLATLLATLSGLALLLAIVGIYGLMAQSVAERTRELGIRLALGATLSQALRQAAMPGIVLALAGVAAGCAFAGMSVKVVRNLVWGISTLDPLTYTSVALGLLLVAAAASFVPALRIIRLNPSDTLREE